jgi:hypothetical protein
MQAGAHEMPIYEASSPRGKSDNAAQQPRKWLPERVGRGKATFQPDKISDFKLY